MAEACSNCRALYETADEILGYGLSKICFEGPIEELTKTNHCQPAIFVTSMACFSALQRRVPGLSFAGAAGLSLGEWTALHAAGALSFEATIRVLEARGRFMQEACEASDGAMVSLIGLDAETVGGICESAGVEIANINSAAQIVLSGERAAIEQAAEAAKAAGAKRAVVLNVAGAYHSKLMAPAAERLGEFLEGIEISRPSIPVVANVSGEVHGEPEDIRRDMVKQVTSPVKWLACVERLSADGVNEYLEFGPGNVLSGLIRRIDSEASAASVQDAATIETTAEAITSAA